MIEYIDVFQAKQNAWIKNWNITSESAVRIANPGMISEEAESIKAERKPCFLKDNLNQLVFWDKETTSRIALSAYRVDMH